jgi:hypothetical protein
MSQTITVQLSDELYAAVQRAAQINDQTPDEWLLAHLPDLLAGATSAIHDGAVVPDAADDWAELEAEQADLDLEWAMLEAEVAAARRNPPPPEDAPERVAAILASWVGKPMSEADALELAMSAELDEWNLDRD